MKPGQQALDLLKIAEDYRVGRCRVLLAQARDETRAVLKAAHRAARRDLRALLTPERDRLAGAIAAAEARLLTRRRLCEQRRVAGMLQLAWPRLEQALRARWEAPAARAAWVTHHLAIALAALPAENWVIQHPQNWPAAECEEARQWLQAHGRAGARFAPDAGLRAGIRVACHWCTLDASLEGLLADRAQIEGWLLQYLAQQP